MAPLVVVRRPWSSLLYATTPPVEGLEGNGGSREGPLGSEEEGMAGMLPPRRDLLFSGEIKIAAVVFHSGMEISENDID